MALNSEVGSAWATLPAMLLLLALAASAQARELAPSEVYSQSAESVCTVIATRDGKTSTLGSGFLVSADGLVATNRHLVGTAAEVLVKCGSREPTSARVVKLYPNADLAMLDARANLGRPLTISESDVRGLVGQQIFVIGNPGGLQNTISDGLISGVREARGEILIQISAPISNGSSGGPVILPNGQVIGVATAMAAEGQNLNFAVPALRLLTEGFPTGRPKAGPAVTAAASGHDHAAANETNALPPGELDSQWAVRIMSPVFWQRVRWDRVDADEVLGRIPRAKTKGQEKKAEGPGHSEGVLAGAKVWVSVVDKGGSGPFGRYLDVVVDPKTVMKGSDERCGEVLARITQALGQPRVLHDYRVGQKVRESTRRAQWEYGDTRITFKCETTEGGDEAMSFWIWGITAGHRSAMEADSDYKWIRCTRRQIITEDGRSEDPVDLEDQVFVIDDFESGSVMAADMTKFAGAKVSRQEVSFGIDGDKTTISVRIDRMLGQYSEILAAKKANLTARAVGTCTKFDPSKPKF